MLSEDRWFEWLNWLVALAIALAIVLFQGRRLTPNVYTVPLGRCDVDWHADRGIVAVACVERDIIKLWPLSVEGVWLEDGVQESEGLSGQQVLTPAASAGS